jgi:hypothetical protein
VLAVGRVLEAKRHVRENTRVSPAVVIALNTCPAHVRRVDAADLQGAKRAVLAELRVLLPTLNLRGARVVQVRRAHAQGDVQPAHFCPAVTRSVLVALSLPGERATPSLTGSPAFYVARTRSHRVIWFEPH